MWENFNFPMRNNKKLLFAFYGFKAGVIGALVAELVPDIGSSALGIVGHVGAWSAVFAALIATGLTAAGETYNRRPFKASSYRSGLLSGAVAGALAGSVAQVVYFVKSGEDFLQDVIFRALCWALMGAVIGWRLSSSIPNLGAKRGLLAGGIGGFLGGLGFVTACQFLPELLARSVGIGFLGLALGLAVVAVEALTREASLEVIWGPKEITSVGLGAKPVYVGGGDDHVYVAGIPEHALSIQLASGKVICTEKSSGKQSHLKDGSRIKMGREELVVKTASA
jgi:hypothetical protein